MISLVKTSDTPLQGVAEAIEKHRAAADRFERLAYGVNDGGQWSRSVAVAARREASSRLALLAMPCETLEDIRLKAEYVAGLLTRSPDEFDADEIVVLLESLAR